MKKQPTFGCRCLHGLSNLLTVCTIPVETKGHLEVLIAPGNWFLFQTSYVIPSVCI